MEITSRYIIEVQQCSCSPGRFHTPCMLLGVIGKRFADAGLRDLMVEAGIVSNGSVASVIEGKKYNQGKRAHKVVAEAMSQLLWQEFEPWAKTWKACHYGCK